MKKEPRKKEVSETDFLLIEMTKLFTGMHDLYDRVRNLEKELKEIKENK